MRFHGDHHDDLLANRDVKGSNAARQNRGYKTRLPFPRGPGAKEEISVADIRQVFSLSFSSLSLLVVGVCV